MDENGIEGYPFCSDCTQEYLSLDHIDPAWDLKSTNKCCICLSLVSDSKSGGLHMNEDGTATLYPVGIAKYEKILLTLNRNKLALDILQGLKCKEGGQTVLESSYLNLLIKTLEG